MIEHVHWRGEEAGGRSQETATYKNDLTRLKTVFAAHRLCTCEFEPSDLYAIREITLVGQLLLLSSTIGMVFGCR